MKILLFQLLSIPKFAVTGVGQPGSKEARNLDWIKTQKVSSQTLLKVLQMDLDQGEAEAIALSAELNSDLLLIDEKIGRTFASQMDLKFVGLMGILLEAKSKGMIQNIKPLLNDLKIRAGFWISQQLYLRALKYANES